MKPSKLLLTLIYLALFNFSSAQFEWTLQNPDPSFTKSWDIFMFDENYGWAVGELGSIIRTENGVDWEKVEIPFDNDLWSVFFINPFEGWITGLNGLLLHSTDSGKTWQQLDPETDEHISNVFFLNPEKGFIIGYDGLVKRTLDGGKSWTKINMNTNSFFRGIYFVDDKKGFIVGNGAEVRKTINGGQSWTDIYVPPPGLAKSFMDIIFCDSLNGYICTYSHSGGIIATHDGGETWSESRSYTNIGGFHLACSGKKVWTVYGEDEIVFTSDGGASDEWQFLDIGVYSDLNGIDFIDSLKGWVVGDDGIIARTVDGGVSWEVLSKGTEWGDIYSLHFLDKFNGFACGVWGYFLQTHNGGQTWEVRSEPGSPLYDFHMVDEKHTWAVGPYSKIYFSRDMGLSWEEQITGLGECFLCGITDVQFVDTLNGYACDPFGVMFYTNDGGKTWSNYFIEDHGVENGGVIRDFHFINKDMGWFIDSRRLFKTIDGGIHWEEKLKIETNEQLLGLEFINDSTAWITSYNGKFYFTEDYGENWEFIQAPTSSTYYDIYFPNEYFGYAIGYYSRTILYTDDGGKTWKETDIPFDELNEIYFYNPFNGWIVGDRAVILHTTQCVPSAPELEEIDSFIQLCINEEEQLIINLKNSNNIYIGGESFEGPFSDQFYPNNIEIRQGDTIIFNWVGPEGYVLDFKTMDKYDQMEIRGPGTIYTYVAEYPISDTIKTQIDDMVLVMNTAPKEAHDSYVLVSRESGKIVEISSKSNWYAMIDPGLYCAYIVNHDGSFAPEIGSIFQMPDEEECFAVSQCIEIEAKNCYQCEMDYELAVQSECVEEGEMYSVEFTLKEDSSIGPISVNGEILSPGDTHNFTFSAGLPWDILLEDMNIYADPEDTLCHKRIFGDSPEICLKPLAIDSVTFTVNENTSKYLVHIYISGSTGNYWVNDQEVSQNPFTSDSILCGMDFSFLILDDLQETIIVDGEAPCSAVLVSDLNETNALDFFPNPANNKMYLRPSHKMISPFSVKICLYSSLAEKLKCFELKLSPNEISELDLSGFTDGMYYLRINLNEEFFIFKFIKQ